MEATSSSAHEKLYMMNRKRKRKESDTRRLFLPYKQQLVGFSTNVNGFSRILHPSLDHYLKFAKLICRDLFSYHKKEKA